MRPLFISHPFVAIRALPFPRAAGPTPPDFSDWHYGVDHFAERLTQLTFRLVSPHFLRVSNPFKSLSARQILSIFFEGKVP